MSLDSTNAENVKLLDQMHEGVLIFAKDTHEIIFCNNPAQKLLSRFVGDSREAVMRNEKFIPVQISSKNVSMKYKQLIDET